MYVAVKGGEAAIENAHRLLDHERRGDTSVPDLSVAQIREPADERDLAGGKREGRAVVGLLLERERQAGEHDDHVGVRSGGDGAHSAPIASTVLSSCLRPI